MKAQQFDGPQKIIEAYLKYKVKIETENFVQQRLKEKRGKLGIKNDQDTDGDLMNK